jgi:hypothetical protein
LQKSLIGVFKGNLRAIATATSQPAGYDEGYNKAES